MNFSDQLAATRVNLERLEALAAKQPDLFEHGTLAQVTPENARVYIHAREDRERDWKAWAREHPANWRLESSASDYSYYDYRGEIEGVEIMVLQAERRPEPKPLFAA